MRRQRMNLVDLFGALCEEINEYAQNMDINPLKDREIFILQNRHDFTLKKIASYLGISYDRVRQIQMQALRALRTRLNYQIDGIMSEFVFFRYLEECGLIHWYDSEDHEIYYWETMKYYLYEHEAENG